MEISRRKILHGMGAVAAMAYPGMGARPAYAESPTAAEAGSAIHLDRNENPHGPPESAARAMRESLGKANRYPDAGALRKKIAEHHNVKEEQIVLGCGSTEILRMAADAFLKPGARLVAAVPTCPLMASFARQKSAEVVEVPLTREYAHDLPAMLAQCTGQTGAVYICNPNNPTGTLTPRPALEDFLHRVPANIPVVIDEAYHHYVEAVAYSSFLDQPAGDERVIVTRTFSKMYALAGLRIGYAVVAPRLAKELSEFALPFAQNVAGVAAAMGALDDKEYVSSSVLRNQNDRQRFFNSADVRYVRVVDSQTNFALLKLDHPIDEVIEHFRQNGIFVGPRFPRLDEFLRVSIGNPEEIKAFWRVWDMLPHKPVHGHAQHRG